jgi:parallel beta-helix repeat protein
MVKDCCKKALVVVIIILFFGMTLIPSGGTTDVKKTTFPQSKGKTLYVGGTGPNNYTTIQSAVNDAYFGDTVFVYDDSSPYYENVGIDKTIKLIGENRQTTIINGTGKQWPIDTLTSNGVTISGFTIKGSYDTGIYLSGNFHVIKNNILTENKYGIWICGNNNQVRNNIITNNMYGGVLILGQRLNRIFCNDIIDNGFGVACDSNSFLNFVKKNNFIGNNENAGFSNCFINIWKENYWDDWRGIGRYTINGIFHIKIVRGPRPGETIFEMTIPLKNYDKYPSAQPYDL